MNTRTVLCLVLAVVVCTTPVAYAQNKYGQETLEDGLLDPFIRYPAIPPHIIELRERWACETLKWADEILRTHQPQIDPPSHPHTGACGDG